MKSTRIRLLSLVLALVLALVPVLVADGDTATNPVSVPSSNKIVASITNNNKKVGEELIVTLSSQFSKTQENVMQAYQLVIDNWDSSVTCTTIGSGGKFTHTYTDASGKSQSIEFTLTDGANANQKILSYELAAGQQFVLDFKFHAPNGISGEKKEITFAPQISTPIQTEKMEVGGKVVGVWEGDFNWNKVTKSSKSNPSLYGGKLTTAIDYHVEVTSDNRASTGEIWTEDITFTDTLTLPEGITLPEGAKVSENQVVDKSGNVLLSFSNLMTGMQVVDLAVESPRKISFKITMPSDKLVNGVPTVEMSNPTFDVSLNAPLLNVANFKGGKIENHVAFDADAYNSDKAAHSEASREHWLNAESADTKIEKTADKKQAYEGQTITYTLKVSNSGGMPSTNNTVKDTLPMGVTLTETQKTKIKEAGATVEESNGQYTITWSTVTIEAGDSVKYTYEVTVKDEKYLVENGINSLTNSAQLNNSQHVNETVEVLHAQFQTSKKIDNPAETYKEGDVIPYTLTYTNNSKWPVSYVELTDVMDAGLIPLDETTIGEDGKPVTEITTDGDYKIGDKTAHVELKDGKAYITWKLDFSPDMLADGAGGEMTVYAKVGALRNVSGDTLENTFEESKVEITVERPTLTLQKSHNSCTAGACTGHKGDEVLTYTFTVTNNSDVDAKNVLIKDVLPAGLTLVDKDGNPISSGTGVSLSDNITSATVNGKEVSWIEASIPARETKTYTLCAKVTASELSAGSDSHLSGNISITNQFEADYMTQPGTDTVTIPFPDPEITKTTNLTEGQMVKNGDTVSFTLTAKNTSALPAENYVLTDTLPQGLTYDSCEVKKNDTVIATVTPTYNKDTNTVVWKLGTLAVGDEYKITLKAKVALTADSVTTLTNLLNDNYSNHDESPVPFDPQMDFDKKILMEDGVTERTDSEIREGCTVTYILRLINKDSTEHAFKDVKDVLPNTFQKFSYTNDNVKFDSSFVGEGYTDKVTGLSGKPMPTPTLDPYHDGGDLKWGDVTVPANSVMLGKVTLTYPSGTNWTNFYEAYYYQHGNNAAPVKNTFYWEKQAKEVSHTIDRGTPSLYMQKGVWFLNALANNGVDQNTPCTSFHQYGTVDGKAVVVYYVAIKNTGDVEIPLKYATDTLPDGVIYKGMIAGNYFSYGSYTGNVNNSSCTTRAYPCFTNLPSLVGDVTIAAAQNGGNSVTFTFTKNGNTFSLKKGEALEFAYLCEIDGNVASQAGSTNTVDVVVDGLVEQGNANITSEGPTNGKLSNDGSCAITGYPDDDTKFTSSVTIFPAPISDSKIVPGIQKKLTAYTPSTPGATEKQFDKDVEWQSDLIWTITLYNDGQSDMPLNKLTDTIDYPFEVQKATLTYGESSYNLTVSDTETVGQRTTDGLPEWDTKTYTFQLDTLANNSALTLKPGESATVKVTTKNSQSRSFASRTIHNTAKLWPEGTFTNASRGEMDDPTDENRTTFQSVKHSDQITIHAGFTTSSYKEVALKSNLTVKASSVAASKAGKNYITLPDREDTVLYTLCVTNDGKQTLSKLFLIDNLPYVGDLGPIESTNRGSEFGMDYAAGITVKLTDRDLGTSRTLAIGSDYLVDYSEKKSGFTEADYNDPSAEGWHTSMTNPSSIRIRIKPGIVCPGDTVKVTFTAKVDPTGAQDGDIAWNSFGYYAEGEDEQYNNFAAPPRVGVAYHVEPKTAKLEFKKQNETGTALEGATFTLVSVTGGEVRTCTSDENGLVAFDSLLPGDYILKETAAPAGYKTPQGSWLVSVSSTQPTTGTWLEVSSTGDATTKMYITVEAMDGAADLVKITGEHAGMTLTNNFDQVNSPELPSVGGSGTQWLMLSGALAMVMAIALLAANKHRQKEGNVG